MKKITALILALAMCFALAACGAEPAPTPTPMPSAEELAETYKAAIEGARSEQDNADRGIMYTGQSEPMGSIYWELLGFGESDVYSCAFSLSVMNVQAYCVGLFMPAEGKAEAVTAGLEKYIEAMQQSFENYLPDQGVIADNAVLETLDDGSVLIVMCEGQDTVRDAVVANLQAEPADNA